MDCIHTFTRAIRNRREGPWWAAEVPTPLLWNTHTAESFQRPSRCPRPKRHRRVSPDSNNVDKVKNDTFPRYFAGIIFKHEHPVILSDHLSFHYHNDYSCRRSTAQDERLVALQHRRHLDGINLLGVRAILQI